MSQIEVVSGDIRDASGVDSATMAVAMFCTWQRIAIPFITAPTRIADQRIGYTQCVAGRAYNVSIGCFYFGTYGTAQRVHS